MSASAWIGKFLSSQFGSTVEAVGGILDEFNLSGEERMVLELELQKVLQARDSELEQTMRKNMEARERIIVAELQHGDNYTKRARPTVVYFGLLVIFINHVFAPLVFGLANWQLPALDLPIEFWVAWGGIVGTWSVGRTAERIGGGNKTTQFITGNQAPLNSRAVG